MSDLALVKRVSPGRAWVEMEWNQSCESCAGKASCFGGHNAPKPEIEAIDPIGVQTGNTVEIEFIKGLKIKASLLVFGLPVFLLFAGYYAGIHFLTDTAAQGAGIIGSVAGLAVSAFLLRVVDKWNLPGLKRLPKIVRVVG